jgi:hypothetical protein
MAFKRKNQYLKDPNGSNELTYVQDEYSQEPYGQEYENPYKDAYNLPEGQTYLAPSAAPSSAFADPSAPRPQDRSPADWKMNNSLDPEREQRYRVKAYLEQKYKKAASNRGVDEARVNADKLNMVGNVGHGLDRIFTAQSVAHKGPGADAGFWSGIKQQGQQGIRSAEDERRAKIEDYLTTQKMGREGAADLALNREYDQKAAMQNPNSDVSQRYQTLFAERYPDYAEQIQGVPAAEIEVFAKYLQDQEKMEMEAADREAKQTALEEQTDIARDRVDIERDRAEAQNRYSDAMIDVKKSEGAAQSFPYYQTRTGTAPKAGVTGEKPAPMPKIPQAVLNNAIKEKKEYDSYLKVKKDAIDSYKIGGEFGFWEGNMPSVEILGNRLGKKSEYDAYVAKIAAQIVEKVPGIRSDADFIRVVKPLLPSPGDPKDTIETKKKIFSDWLESKTPDAPTFKSLPEEVQAQFGGLATEEKKPEQKLINGVLYDKVEGGWKKSKEQPK